MNLYFAEDVVAVRSFIVVGKRVDVGPRAHGEFLKGRSGKHGKIARGLKNMQIMAQIEISEGGPQQIAAKTPNF